MFCCSKKALLVLLQQNSPVEVTEFFDTLISSNEFAVAFASNYDVDHIIFVLEERRQLGGFGGTCSRDTCISWHTYVSYQE